MTQPSFHNPSPSGPRERIASVIRVTAPASGVAPSNLASPLIPHISAGPDRSTCTQHGNTPATVVCRSEIGRRYRSRRLPDAHPGKPTADLAFFGARRRTAADGRLPLREARSSTGSAARFANRPTAEEPRADAARLTGKRAVSIGGDSGTGRGAPDVCRCS
ncbi:hypothetical protein GCM10027259_24600 [Micromonospora palomenae]